MEQDKKSLLGKLEDVCAVVKGSLILDKDCVRSVNGMEGVASFPLSIGVKEAVKVDGKKLIGFLKKVTHETVDISYSEEKKSVVVKYGKTSKSGFIASEGNYPAFTDEVAETKTVNPEAFEKAVGLCSSVMAKKFSSEQAPFIHYNGKLKRLEATDRRKLMLANIDLGDKDFLVSDTVFSAASKKEVTSIKVTGKWVTLEGSVKIMMVNCNAEYPDFKALIDKIESAEKVPLELPGVVSEMITRAAVFGMELDNYFEFKLKDKVMSITGRCDTAWFEDSMEVFVTGEANFSANSFIMSSALGLGGTIDKIDNMIVVRQPDWMYITTLAESGTARPAPTEAEAPKVEEAPKKAVKPSVPAPAVKEEVIEIPPDEDDTVDSGIDEGEDWN